MKIFDKVIKYIPLITVLLIFVSYIKLQFYYKNFGVNVYEYMDSSELVLSFIPDIYSIIINIISIIVAYSLFLSILSKKSKQNFDERSKKRGYRQKKLHYYFEIIKLDKLRRIGFVKSTLLIWRIITHNQIMFLIILLVFSISYGNIEFQSCHEVWYEDEYVALVFFWGMYVAYIISSGLELDKNTNLAFMSTISIFIFVTIAIMAHRVECDCNKVKEGSSSIQISFNYFDCIVESSENFIYLGGTRNYLFIYNLEKDETLIFEKGDVGNLRIKKNDEN